ncbi:MULTISPECIES: DNA polymerase III subunit alpha [unclassified Lysobacter]|uniref:DNA polymerase III subunit alpha n=1 Tax=unclassified Lysobacter TaxID=2635362 RepID=UPI0006F45547|nr:MULTISPECIES: DNA polymerase III subunit alpha [unclassified Lysobacter]KQZ59892.1 DNA polymerase III subunit alpha [Lysobacter sp. Root559]KRC38342.1 DNA polymerase III subunit alpha [Lysobacter sp. Root76]KRD71539.1 DNA polymerase III subunit alpha [Lysobacter sp. Root96]
MSARFVHLHLHSEYSLADSTIRIGELVKRCASLGQPAVALTDIDNLFATVKFYKAAEGAGLKPIIGADIGMADGNETPSRMTLLCRDRGGYLTLSRLLSRAWLEGQRIDGVVLRPEWLREDNAGLFAMAGRHSLGGRLAIGGRHELAEAWIADWQSVLDDRLHLELTRTRRDGEDAFNAFALHASSKRGLAVVASNDARFLDRDGFEAHEARVCIASGRVLDDPKRPRDYSEEQYLKSSEEMAELFADIPDAIDNALALATRCNVELKLGEYALPAFPVPSEHTIESWLRNSAREGLEKRLEKAPLAEGKSRQDYDERLEIELDVIIKMGFPGYFLIVADFINWAKDHGIPVGPGRGSGAGSLVAWALGITDLDPLPYDLLFERFLNPERVSMPDFDIDFCMDRRDEVIDYVAAKYGRDRVSQIITYGTMAAKAVVRDSGRVLGHPYGFVDGIAKLIPNTLGISLDDALGNSDAAKQNPMLASADLIDRYRTEDDVRDLLDLALSLEDLTRNAGKHAGGVVIAPSPLSDFCPLFAEHDGEGRGRNPVTQFDKDDVEAVGLVKFDFLGLRTLTIIDWAVKAINVRRAAAGEAPLDITALELDDKLSYELFARGDTVAVFQFESRGMRELLKRAKPDTFEDIIALAALFRPGPLGSGMDREWVDRKHGNTEVSYPHPSLEPVLSPTYGVIVYQEQVMQIAQVLAGYTLGGADMLRRAMGKKKPEEMAKERAKFEAGCAERGIPAKQASPIFDLMEKFAEYGFNKSHSAAYALVAYQTAWLKVHYPAEFMAAVLSSDMDNTDKIVGFLDEARTMGLDVLPPDVDASAYMFEAKDARTIRYGLGAVKGVGRGACEAIVDARRAGPFDDLLDFCKRVDSGKLNRRALEALTQAGALDRLGKNRASLMLQLPEVLKATDQLARERDAGQVSLFGGFEAAAPALHLDLSEADEWPLAQLLAGERETLGHYLSGHPFDPYRDELRGLVGNDLGELDRIWENRPESARSGWRPELEVVVAGQVVGLRKKGDSQMFVQIEDGRGRLECAFFAETYSEFASMLARDRLLVVQGGLREDAFSGGFALRAQRCWDYSQVCAKHAQRLSMRLDLRVPGTWQRVDALLAKNRPGQTPIRLDLLRTGAAGMLDLNGSQSVRVDADLVGTLRAQPGVRAVKLTLAKPWAN